MQPNKDRLTQAELANTALAHAELCDHCGAEMAPGAGLRHNDRAFCCGGCLTVAQIIAGSDLEAFYTKREGYSPRPVQKSCAGFDTNVFSDQHTDLNPDGSRTARVQIGGLQCSACVWLLERAVKAVPGVVSCQVSYGTGQGTIRWQPASTPLSTVAQRIVALGYEPRAADARDAIAPEHLRRLGVATFCAVNTMLLSVAVYLGWGPGMDEAFLRLFQWAVLALATPAVFYASVPFFERATIGLKHGVLSMDVPVALAIIVMYTHGVIQTLTGGDAYLDSLTMLIALLLAGRWVEMRGRSRAQQAADAVLGELPASARVCRADGSVETVDVATLKIGDRVLVGLGDTIPADGTIRSGGVDVNRASLTGESRAVALGVNDPVTAGALIIAGAAEIEVVAAGDDTLLASMARRVRDARATRPRAIALTDRIAPWFTGVTLSVASLTFIGWWALEGLSAALPPTVAVLVVACPCALALATPAAFMFGIGAAAREGAYIRDASVLERLADVTLIAFDKTGTLTDGQHGVSGAPDDVLQLAAGLARFSSHPVSQSIMLETQRRRLAVPNSWDVMETAGTGLRGMVEGRAIELVRGEPGLVGPSVSIREGGVELCAITLRDHLRSDSAGAIAALEVPVHMLTGDQSAEAERVNAMLGCVAVHANMRPDDKAAWIASQREHGEVVLFVGDGVNDAPALCEADVGAAMARGASAALLAADIVVTTQSIVPVANAIWVAKRTRHVLHMAARWSIVYNFVAIAGAAAGWVNPLVAVIVMPASSLVVIGLASTLRRRRNVATAARPEPVSSPTDMQALNPEPVRATARA